jgi:hypothetical protein
MENEMVVTTKAQMQCIQFNGVPQDIINFIRSKMPMEEFFPYKSKEAGWFNQNYWDFEDVSGQIAFSLQKGMWLVLFGSNICTFHNDYFKEFFEEVKE